MRIRWLFAFPVVLLALVVGGTWTYINVWRGDAPARLSVSAGEPGAAESPAPDDAAATDAADTATVGGLDGTWNAGAGSEAGYRVDEVLFGQTATAVGRTTGVEAAMTVSGTTVTAATVTVDLTGMKSDETRRDNQFRGRIMDVATYPTATFTLTSPIDLGRIPADGGAVKVPATGELTLRGTTRSVVFDLEAARRGATAQVSGNLPVVFSEWDIPNPSFGPVSTEDHGELEFLVVFSRDSTRER